MTTRPLPGSRALPGRRPAGSGRLAAPAPAVPSFKLAFPAPAGHGVDHPHYEIRQAANRVYQSRRGAYRTMAQQLEAAAMLDYVRQDVLMRLLETEAVALGPLEYARYRWLDATKFRAWLPFQRRKAEELYAAFRRKIDGRLAEQDLGRY